MEAPHHTGRPAPAVSCVLASQRATGHHPPAREPPSHTAPSPGQPVPRLSEPLSSLPALAGWHSGGIRNKVGGPRAWRRRGVPWAEARLGTGPRPLLPGFPSPHRPVGASPHHTCSITQLLGPAQRAGSLHPQDNPQLNGVDGRMRPVSTIPGVPGGVFRELEQRHPSPGSWV